MTNYIIKPGKLKYLKSRKTILYFNRSIFDTEESDFEIISRILADDSKVLDSFGKKLSTVIMGKNTYQIARKICNPPFPGIRNFIVTSDELLLNNSVEGLEFGAYDDVLEYLLDDDREETVLILGGRKLIYGLLNDGLSHLAKAVYPLEYYEGLSVNIHFRRELSENYRKNQFSGHANMYNSNVIGL